MSLTKRRISRRALGVVVGASLLVLGLEAPAFAVPGVSAVAPNSGPADCVVVVTGTGFLDFPQAQQTLIFDDPAVAGVDLTVAAADWFAISDTEIWANVPAVAAGTTYTVTLTDPTGTSISTGTFQATTGAGTCGPTITSFTPTCASAGATVVITGTNLLDDLAGGTVSFSPYTGAAADATHTVPDVDSPTSLSVLVPSNAGDGRIQVVTSVDTNPNTAGIQGAFSATNFLVPPPDCVAGGVTHARSISLSLRRHLIARGAVTVEDDTAECIAGVPVKIQRKKKGGGWKNVGSTTTNDAGKYKRSIKDRPGKYRALAPAVTLADDTVCTRARSARVTHRH